MSDRNFLEDIAMAITMADEDPVGSVVITRQVEDPVGSVVITRQVIEAARSEADIEREQVEAVFALGGGELEDEPWQGHRYWYEGPPDYADGSKYRDQYNDDVEYRTVVQDYLWKGPKPITDNEGTWQPVETFKSSGETECPWKGVPCEDQPPMKECDLCEERLKSGQDCIEHGWIYLGDGWAEVVYKLQRDQTEAQALVQALHQRKQPVLAKQLNRALGDTFEEERVPAADGYDIVVEWPQDEAMADWKQPEHEPTGQLGIVYLLHIDPPYRHAKHYLGWTTNLDRRVSKHMTGQGSPLVKAAVNAGHSVELVRTWDQQDRNFERLLKNIKNTPRFCPTCQEQYRDKW